MALKKSVCSPCLEPLEGRRLLRAAIAPPAGPPRAEVVAPESFGASTTLDALRGFVASYPSLSGGPRYDPAFDLNHNGQIGQDDGRILLRTLPPVAPRGPLNLQVRLAAEDQARGTTPQNSGGATYSRQPTVIGRTSPGALIFSGTGTTDLKLRGPAAVADERGYFALTPTMTDGINQFDLQAVDRYGRQVLRAFPILWLGFDAYEAAHPENS